jgi:hypothetical protein
MNDNNFFYLGEDLGMGANNLLPSLGVSNSAMFGYNLAIIAKSVQ